jgi:cytochrome d ubiquinol oxidase subunit II
VLTIFMDLYPRVMVSSTNAADSLTVANASSSPYALKVMTIVALIFLPLVLIYQGWTYHVFRKRLSTSDLEEQGSGQTSARVQRAAPPRASTSE